MDSDNEGFKTEIWDIQLLCGGLSEDIINLYTRNKDERNFMSKDRKWKLSGVSGR